MAGAYTALPPEDSTPDVPDGWDIDWTFPGPAPPGYSFDYGFDIDAPGLVIPYTSTSGTITLTDHDTYVTSSPIQGSTVELSAAFADTGEPVQILSGSTSYVYETLEGGYSGINFDIELGVTELDDGRTVTVTAESTPFSGYDISETKDIVVAVPTEENFRAEVSATWSTDQPAEPGAGILVKVQVYYGYPTEYAGFSVGSVYGYGENISIDEEPGVAVSCSGYSSGAGTIGITLFEHFRVRYSLQPLLMSGSLSLTLKLYISDELFSAYQFSIAEWKTNNMIWSVYPSECTVYEYY